MCLGQSCARCWMWNWYPLHVCRQSRRRQGHRCRHVRDSRVRQEDCGGEQFIWQGSHHQGENRRDQFTRGNRQGEHPGLTTARYIRFLLFVFNNVLVYNSTILNLRSFFVISFKRVCRQEKVWKSNRKSWW